MALEQICIIEIKMDFNISVLDYVQWLHGDGQRVRNTSCESLGNRLLFLHVVYGPMGNAYVEFSR